MHIVSIYLYFELIGKVASAFKRDQDDTLFKDSASDDTWRTHPQFQELVASNVWCVELPLELVANFASCWPNLES